jgi:hypothetical protein
LIPGWILIALGGSGLTGCTLHFANLFPSTKSFVLGIIPTALLVSGFTLTIFQLIVRAGVPLYALFIVYSCFQLFFIVVAFVFQPLKGYKVTDLPNRRKKKNIEQENQMNGPIELEETKANEKVQETFQAKELKMELLEGEEIKETILEVEEPVADNSTVENSNVVEEKSSTTVVPKKKFKISCNLTVVKQMLTLDYLITGLFLCIHSIIYTWYTGTLFDQFASMGDTDHGKFKYSC